MPTRLNKYLSEIGYCSRREADKLIAKGAVKVDGVVATTGDKIEETSIILVDDKPIKKQEKNIYIVLNKPAGLTSTTDLKDKTNVIDYVNLPTRIFTIGRLDKDSEGLLLLTNDGDIVNKILRSGNNHEKEYVVTVNKNITSLFIKHLHEGVEILGKLTKKAEVTQIDKVTFKIILTEGMNRQIRRMCSALGYSVKKLVRTRIMNITDKGLPRGSWRYLTDAEVKKIKELTENSQKTV